MTVFCLKKRIHETWQIAQIVLYYKYSKGKLNWKGCLNLDDFYDKDENELKWLEQLREELEWHEKWEQRVLNDESDETEFWTWSFDSENLTKRQNYAIM